MAPFHVTLGFLLLASGLASTYSTSASGGILIELTPVDGNTNLSGYELIRRAVERSHRRIWRLTEKQSAAGAVFDPPLSSGNDSEYFTYLAIGTPRSVPFTAIVDTGSDLTWTQCLPCSQCFEQPTPLFDPSTSVSYSAVQCSSNFCQALASTTCNRSSNHCQYSVLYADLSHTVGELATETFTVGSSEISGVAFGCGHNNVDGVRGSSGLLGLGRGALSLVSQLGMPKFSYCLTQHGSTKKSTLLLGALPDHHAAQTVISTPLVRNHVFSSFYYLNLSGITVGNTSLDIPESVFAIDSHGGGGMVIDSGTFLTYLEEAAYEAVLEAFLTQTRLSTISSEGYPVDLCFGRPAAHTRIEDLEVPKLVFHFRGGDLELPPENYFAQVDARAVCLMMSGSRGLSILGNFQQQNVQVSYDLENEMLSFSPARCHR